MNTVDIASFLHFFNFMILGILIKNQYLMAFLIGILWEIFEYLSIRNKTINNILNQHFYKYKPLWNEINTNKITDLIINMIGYYIGNKIIL